jgi:hypothetical protein
MPYEEFMELIRIKIRVESLADLIKEYGDSVTINQAIAILNLEVNEDA